LIDSRLEALVNPFSNLKSESPENIDQVQFEKDEAVEKAVHTYFLLPFAFKAQGLDDYLPENIMQKYISPLETNVLTPPQISLFIQRLKKQATGWQYFHELTGYFISRQIQDSYNNGHNDFVLELNNSEIYNLIRLQGTEENPLKLKIVGDAGSWLGYQSEYCEYDINGDVGENCGNESRNSIYRIKGNINTDSAEFARDCIFEIEGKPLFQGKSQGWAGSAKDCKFITSNYETAKMIAPTLGEGNELVYKK